MLTINKLLSEDLLKEAEREIGRYEWEGTFADYLGMVSEDASISRLSHKLIYDATLSDGVDFSEESSRPVYKLFKDNVYGQDDVIDEIVEYFASSSKRLEIRKRILLLVGPPASGKSTIVALIKDALERYTRTDKGAVYAIKGCPMQEEPLHLIPKNMRAKLQEQVGIFVEGDLCPRCRYVVRTLYKGKISEIPVMRVIFSEQEAIGIGHYIATSNPSDASLLVGSVDSSLMEGDRLEVAGKAFRLDGELNVANRGLMEFVEVFKSSPRLLTALLGLSQEQLIKMDRFGSVYADEVVIGHSNEGDFKTFLDDPSSEALRDRIMRINVPYNLKVRDEVKIYDKMLKDSGLESVHMPPLTLPIISSFAVLTRLGQPQKSSMALLDKLHAYDGRRVSGITPDDLDKERKANPGEGMQGISPRSVMSRLSARSTMPDVSCISPLNALDSLWQGRSENISLSDEQSDKLIEFVKGAIEDYNQRVLREVQMAFEERFEDNAANLLSDYLTNISMAITSSASKNASKDIERSMREMEKHAGISSDGDRVRFRLRVHKQYEDFRNNGVPYDFRSEPQIREAIESRLFPDKRTLRAEIEPPKATTKIADWRRKRGAMHNRLIQNYGYCPQCAEDTVEYAIHLLKGSSPFRIVRDDIEWTWDLNPTHLARPQELFGEQ